MAFMEGAFILPGHGLSRWLVVNPIRPILESCESWVIFVPSILDHNECKDFPARR